MSMGGNIGSGEVEVKKNYSKGELIQKCLLVGTCSALFGLLGGDYVARISDKHDVNEVDLNNDGRTDMVYTVGDKLHSRAEIYVRNKNDQLIPLDDYQLLLNRSINYLENEDLHNVSFGYNYEVNSAKTRFDAKKDSLTTHYDAQRDSIDSMVEDIEETVKTLK